MDIKKKCFTLLLALTLSPLVFAKESIKTYQLIIISQPDIKQSDFETPDFLSLKKKKVEELNQNQTISESDKKELIQLVHDSWFPRDIDTINLKLKEKEDLIVKKIEEDKKREAELKKEEEKKALSKKEEVSPQPYPETEVVVNTVSNSGKVYPPTVEGARAAFEDITREYQVSESDKQIWSDIITKESGWNPLIANPYSGAYGLPQSLPAGKMASAGGDWQTNPYTQLVWMYNYVHERYGSFSGVNWYSRGWY